MNLSLFSSVTRLLVSSNSSLIQNTQNVISKSSSSTTRELEDLPNEVLLEIIKRLPLQEQFNLRLVSSRWKYILDETFKFQESLKLFSSLGDIEKYCAKLAFGYPDEEHHWTLTSYFSDDLILGVDQFTEANIVKLCDYFPNIQKLIVCFDSNANDIEAMYSRLPLLLRKYRHSLKSLSIAGTNDYFESERIDESLIDAIQELLPHLTTLHLNVPRLSDLLISRRLVNIELTNLSTFSIEHDERLDIEVEVINSRFNSAATHLNLTFVSRDLLVLQEALEKGKLQVNRLRHLFVKEVCCGSSTFGSITTHLPQLRFLGARFYLPCNCFNDYFRHLSFDLLSLLSSLKHLTELHLIGIKYRPTLLMEPDYGKRRLENVTSLYISFDIYNAVQIEASYFFPLLIKWFPNLKSLRLGGNVSFESLESLKSGVKLLPKAVKCTFCRSIGMVPLRLHAKTLVERFAGRHVGKLL